MRAARILFILGLFMFSGARVFCQEDLPDDALPEASVRAPSMDAPLAASSGALPVDNSIIQINPVDEKEKLYSFELRDAEIGDVFRILAHDYKLNLLVDKDVQGKVTATLSSVSLDEALEAIAESQNLALEKKNNIVKVTPNLITKTFTLKYIEAKSVVESAQNSLASGGDTGSSAQGAASPSAGAAIGAEASVSASGSSSEKKVNTVYDLLSDKGIILLGKQPNSVMVIDYPPNIKKVEEYLKAIDRKMTSKFFKLKYLKAADVVGQSTNTGSEASSSYAAPAATESGSSSGTSSGSTS